MRKSVVKSNTWQGLVTEAEAAEDISSSLTDLASVAINKINSGENVDLSSLASQSLWQKILLSSTSMESWASSTALLFADSLSPLLAPGTKFLMGAFADAAVREQLRNQASSTFSAYNLMEQLASTALGNSGSGTIIQQVGLKSFWEGIKSTANLMLDSRDTLLYSVTELSKITLNPTGYLSDKFWSSDVGQEFSRERDEFFGLIPPKTNIRIDEVTHTAAVDPDLSYWYMWGKPVLGVLDTVTLLQVGNMRWDRSTADGAPYYETLVLDPTIKGISMSGINTDGAKLDELTKRLSLVSPHTFTITNSAASDVLIKSNITTEKVIITNSQSKQVSVNDWIDEMGLDQRQVLVVDTIGDFPYRPTDLLSLKLDDIMNIIDVCISNKNMIYWFHETTWNPNRA